jgi:putative MFS transporter
MVAGIETNQQSLEALEPEETLDTDRVLASTATRR